MGNCLGKNQGEYDLDSKVNFTGGNVHIVGSLESWDEKMSELKNEGKLAVVNFSASWCGPCRMIIPFYAELSLKHPHLLFLTVDVDQLPDLSSSFDVHATPTFFFLQDGGNHRDSKLVGANKPELEKRILAFAESCHRCSK